MANNMIPETMLMSGVTVDFPYKPYPCQIAMLGKIIKALQQSKNCLLESPTGTGKTLTLLCAALAWQQKEIEQIRLSSSVNDSTDKPAESTTTTTKQTPISRIFYCTRTHKQLEQVARQLTQTVYKDKIRMTLLSSRDNYCIHPIVSKGPNKNYECRKVTRPDKQKFGQSNFKSECGFFERLKGKTASDFFRPLGTKQIPRVFDIEQFNSFCQTTHAVCPYYTSRLLINDVQIILCPYNYLIDPRVRNSMQMSVNHSIIIIDEAHNIEDCARESMKFDMRKYDFDLALEEIHMNQKALEMAQIKAAQLIVNETGFSATQEPICDTQLNSTQQQTTRRTPGYSEMDQLDEENDLLEHLNIDQLGNNQEQTSDVKSDDQAVANALKFLAERFSRILLWFDTKDPREKYTFTPKELVEQFHQAKFIDRSIVNVHKPATKNQPASKRGVIQDASRIRKALSKSILNAPEYIKFSDETANFLEDLDLCLSVLYSDDYQFFDDYKITLKTIPFEPSASAVAQMQQSSSNSMDMPNNEWTDMSQKSTQLKRHQYNIMKTTYPLHTQQLTFYCLSPSVAFAKDLKLARSLIFASGTLAPLATYSGELKIPFDIQMECNHVIDVQRTFITALGHGRNSNIKLRATYQNTDKFEFQDECGLVLLDICQRVPYGVLCFVPSYRFLNVIITRWTSSGLWKQLNEHKSVFFEEKSSANFQNTINLFREANGTLKIVKELSANAKRVNAMFKRKKTSEEVSTTNSPYFTAKGGLLLAVCRGRASEGIDFSDNNARCVITLGIPYPNVQDEEVIFKRNYNNEQNKRVPQIMNGSDWYDSQAYRALNQALGRCIRHKNDWGALIIVDERIVNNMQDKHFNNKISLWIKQRLFISRNYDVTMNALEKFSTDMKKADELLILQNEQQQLQIQQSEKQLNDDEQRRFSLIVPPLTDIPKKTEKKKWNYRQWNIGNLTDDDDEEDKKEKETIIKQNKSRTFSKFVAKRPIAMPPPSQVQNVIDITDDEDENMKNCQKSDTQYSTSTPPVPILSQKINSFQSQSIIDITDDDDDFIQSTASFSSRPNKKKLKST
ncbi:unnamed protein product [Adineta steineri]|uniref:Helicase ATP-binding domain-containing protein n=1 Tax=Adineta steineri TaxID=433720 RepID=A0A814XTZ2_9BILA|nr:unnamed protein product [Adineta steineri]CAF1220585.1 unnamed protein product [Adineta steineri]